MKKSLIYSLILHALLILSALFFVQERKEQETPHFFYAKIIMPEELKEEKTLKKPVPPVKPPIKPTARTFQKTQKEEVFRMPKLPEDIPLPKDLSAAPTRKLPEEDEQKVYRQKDSDQEKLIAPIEETPSPKDPSAVPTYQATEKDEQEAYLSDDNEGQGLPIRPSFKPFREKLFDRDVIGKLAQKGKKDIKPDSNITFDTIEFRYYGYMQRLKEKIEDIWKYPLDAAEKGIYGDLYIRFTIKKDGKLGAVELVRTSGHPSLDNSAMKALRAAEPYWPLPDEWGKDGLTITGRFIYSLYGVYIR